MMSVATSICPVCAGLGAMPRPGHEGSGPEMMPCGCCAGVGYVNEAFCRLESGDRLIYTDFSGEMP